MENKRRCLASMSLSFHHCPGSVYIFFFLLFYFKVADVLFGCGSSLISNTGFL